MKRFLVICLLVLSNVTIAAPAYTLADICAKYNDDNNGCQRVPFCQAIVQRSRPGGCFAKPGFEYTAPLCAAMDYASCASGATTCQIYPALKTQVQCVTTRDYL